MWTLDRHHRVAVVPFQKSGVAAANGLSIAECEQAAWAITTTGQRYRGAAAINMTLAVALGISLPMIVYQLPGLQQLQDWVYAWVVRNRHWLPGVKPYCHEFPERCQ